MGGVKGEEGAEVGRGGAPVMLRMLSAMVVGVPAPVAVSSCRMRIMSSSLCSVFFRHERHTSSRLDTCRAPAPRPAGWPGQVGLALLTLPLAQPLQGPPCPHRPIRSNLPAVFYRIHTEHTSTPSLSPGSPSVTLPHVQAKFKVTWPHKPSWPLTHPSQLQSSK